MQISRLSSGRSFIVKRKEFILLLFCCSALVLRIFTYLGSVLKHIVYELLLL